jgi:hypothetical protein
MTAATVMPSIDIPSLSARSCLAFSMSSDGIVTVRLTWVCSGWEVSGVSDGGIFVELEKLSVDSNPEYS